MLGRIGKEPEALDVRRKVPGLLAALREEVDMEEAQRHAEMIIRADVAQDGAPAAFRQAMKCRSESPICLGSPRCSNTPTRMSSTRMIST